MSKPNNCECNCDHQVVADRHACWTCECTCGGDNSEQTTCQCCGMSDD